MQMETQIGEHEIELLFRKYYRYLCVVAMNCVHDTDLAEDLVQDFFISFWERSPDRPAPENFKSYASRAVKNSCIDFLRRQAVKEKHQIEGQDQQDAFDPQMVQEELDERHTRLVRIFELIDGLPEGQKQILRLHVLEKLTYKQIAERQGVSLNTVRTQLTRAYASLRRSMAGMILLSLIKYL